ncbi:MAG TPA: DUF1800 domain-containing protein [Acidimicrobiales bacterium]|nr:DUF1800 domain-containing protein [Acidimicrobiales bacterium]
MADPLASRHDVARLLGRAAFGATAADLDAWTGKPYYELVEHLLTPSDLGSLEFDDATRLVDTAAGMYADRENGAFQLEQAQMWWLERMRNTRWPLRERMTLLWHDHFATAVSQPWPDVAMLMTQNQTLRGHAVGNFEELMKAITLDPAMLHWLDGALSVVGASNENFARELFELFTLGTSPQQYAETDIREAARALTGWVVDGFNQPVFDPARHDEGVKHVLGRRIVNRGAEEYLDVLDAALAMPAAPRFVAWKLVQKLAYDPGPADRLSQPDPLVARVGDELRRTHWDISAALRVLLTSEEFRLGPQRVVRQPVEQVVHACKALGVSAGRGPVLTALTDMGQRLFDPPNVGGWPTATEWISPGTSLARYAFSFDANNESGSAGFFGLFATLPPSSDLTAWAARLGLAGWHPNTERTMRTFLVDRAAADEAQRQAGVLMLALNSPDWTVM